MLCIFLRGVRRLHEAAATVQVVDAEDFRILLLHLKTEVMLLRRPWFLLELRFNVF